MTTEIFLQFSLIILTALIISFVMRILKQPLIIAYILTGILISPFFLEIISESELVLSFSQFGVAFLLFIVGLHLNPKVIKEFGLASLTVGLIQIIVTAGSGFLLANYLGFSLVSAIYISIALTFSSTIIIMKIVSDKQALETLYGKISIGILILQDFIVILILMILPYFSSNAFSISTQSIFYGILAILTLFFAAIFILPSVTKFIAKNQELLFLFSISWCFFIASLFFNLGFSMEIGALLAGIALSVSPYHVEIASKVRPLRDFFIIIFFILLGLQLQIGAIPSIIKYALIFSAFVFLIKLFIVMITLGLLGYSKRTSFFTGINLGQISEFSFIIVALGVSLGHITSEILGLVTLVGIITITSSTYLMSFSDKIYPHLSAALSLFEKKGRLKDTRKIPQKHDTILFGYNRIGFSLLESLRKLRRKYLIVDFNPITVKNLSKQGINTIYGDADDSDFLDEVKIDKARLIISTIPDLESNILIVNKVRQKNKDSIVILTAHQIENALKLYSLGASYVITPHFLGGQYTAKLIEKNKTDAKDYEEEKKKHLQILKRRLQEGQEHPVIEKD